MGYSEIGLGFELGFAVPTKLWDTALDIVLYKLYFFSTWQKYLFTYS